MKLRTQILCLGLAGAALVSAAGGIGLLAVSSMAVKIEASALSSQALQATLSADMMHDALRGDAQRALLAAIKGDAATIAAARTDLDDHVATFDTALAKIAASGIDDRSRKALESALPVVKQYTQAAQAVVAGSALGVAQAEAQLPALNQAFAQLEDALEALSGMIEEDGAAISEAASTSVTQSRWCWARCGWLASWPSPWARRWRPLGIWLRATWPCPSRWWATTTHVNCWRPCAPCSSASATP